MPLNEQYQECINSLVGVYLGILYIVKLLSYWYAKQTMRVRWGDCISSPFRVSNGVRQGGILSPYLFNVYMDDLSRGVIYMLKGMSYLELFMCSIAIKNTLFRTFCTPMYTCHLWWNYTTQSFHKLKVAFNNAFRMMHNLPTYCSACEMFTVNVVADCKAVIRNLVHRFMMRLTISKHLLVRSILSSDLVCSSHINRRHWARLLYVHYHGG